MGNCGYWTVSKEWSDWGAAWTMPAILTRILNNELWTVWPVLGNTCEAHWPVIYALSVQARILDLTLEIQQELDTATTGRVVELSAPVVASDLLETC